MKLLFTYTGFNLIRKNFSYVLSKVAKVIFFDRARQLLVN